MTVRDANTRDEDGYVSFQVAGMDEDADVAGAEVVDEGFYVSANGASGYPGWIKGFHNSLGGAVVIFRRRRYCYVADQDSLAEKGSVAAPAVTIYGRS